MKTRNRNTRYPTRPVQRYKSVLLRPVAYWFEKRQPAIKVAAAEEQEIAELDRMWRAARKDPPIFLPDQLEQGA